MIRTIEWTDDGIVMLDQRLLPGQEVYNTYRTPEEVAGIKASHTGKFLKVALAG